MSRAPPAAISMRREPGMQRQADQPRADRRQRAVRDAAELFQQTDRRDQPSSSRRVEPLERARIAAPGDHVEQRAAEIDAMDLRLAMRRSRSRASHSRQTIPAPTRPARPAR